MLRSFHTVAKLNLGLIIEDGSIGRHWIVRLQYKCLEDGLTESTLHVNSLIMLAACLVKYDTCFQDNMNVALY